MIILLHRNFEKRYGKLPKNVRERFKERRNLLIKQPFHPLLNNHALSAKWDGCRSINITGDYRAIYREESRGIVRFLAIGTHPELYGD